MKKRKLFEKINVNRESISEIVKLNWSHINLSLGDLIKTSQNHTYKGNGGVDGSVLYIVRVTPDPTNDEEGRIRDELIFLRYMEEKGLSVCGSVDAVGGRMYVREGSTEAVVIAVFNYAKGKPIDPPIGPGWMLDKELNIAVGKWMGQCHNLSRKFTVEYPEVAARFRNWTELHDSTLSDEPVHPDDQQLALDPKRFGVLHGDINTGNFFYDDTTHTIHVYDWDQTQRGWYLYELAQAIYVPWILSTGGNPMDGSPIVCDLEQLINWMIEGYECVDEMGKVDRVALHRMVMIKRSFQEKFCKRAIVEVGGDKEFAGFIPFFNFVLKWVESNPQLKF